MRAGTGVCERSKNLDPNEQVSGHSSTIRLLKTPAPRSRASTSAAETLRVSRGRAAVSGCTGAFSPSLTLRRTPPDGPTRALAATALFSTSCSLIPGTIFPGRPVASLGTESDVVPLGTISRRSSDEGQESEGSSGCVVGFGPRCSFRPDRLRWAGPGLSRECSQEPCRWPWDTVRRHRKPVQTVWPRNSVSPSDARTEVADLLQGGTRHALAEHLAQHSLESTSPRKETDGETQNSLLPFRAVGRTALPA